MMKALTSAWSWSQQRAPELLIVLFLALLPLDEAKHIPIVVFLVVFFIKAYKRQIPLTGPLKLYLLSCALLLVPMILSLAVAIQYHDLVQEIVRWSLYMLAGIAIVLWFQQRIYASVLVYGIAAVLLFWSFDALIQYVWGQNLLGFEYNQSRLTGIFHPKMNIGNMMVHWLPFLLEAVRRYSFGQRTRAWAGLLILPVVAVIMLSGSRAAWLVMLVNLPLYALYLMVQKIINWKFMLGAVVAVVLSVAVVVQSSPEMANRFQVSLGFVSTDLNQMNRASSGRIPIWQDGWLVFKHNPVLGVGIDNLQLRLAEIEDHNHSRQGHVHLFGLDVLVFTGIVGFLCYVIFLGLNVRLWWRHAQQGQHLAVAAGLALLLMSMPINVHWGFYTLRTGSMLILFLAVAYGVYSNTRALKS